MPRRPVQRPTKSSKRGPRQPARLSVTKMDSVDKELEMAVPLARSLNIAHRGANELAPENTLEAFRRALEVGADGIELDVRLSADGVPVVIHDATVDATTNGSGRVDRKTLAELRQLDAGAAFESTRGNASNALTERIPTLAEILDALGGRVLINIELKRMGFIDGGLERAVVDQVKRSGAQEHVLLSSFNPFALRQVQTSDPAVATALIYTRPARVSLCLARLIIPRPTTALHPHHSLVDAEYVRCAHARGTRVHVWTVDDPARMRCLLDWGVDGIITNKPDTLAQLLKTAS